MIYHEKLIKKLCRTHLCVTWREGLWVYRVVTEKKKFYSGHPVVKEFWGDPMKLWKRLFKIRLELIRRGCRATDMPPLQASPKKRNTFEYLTLQEQIILLKNKTCQCVV